MCIDECIKYDCTKCQRRIRATEQKLLCPEAGSGTCTTTIDFITYYLPASQCETCENKRKEEEAKARKRKRSGSNANKA
ncbi:unnamed protein product [Fusarium graminearum]|uniref:Chromosome 4, complete genome n=2 Tax=Gibberella zeae TaxID=5518 RepID=A0A098DMH1_GIBZE|nr:unnamed protein product [Fusarium graminearum]CAF3459390.1 unnamed protein product [Fusarium graminearum]CAF3619679.1 unnamed protein product [Fusarium graminearum]CAG1963232.1 unnamed protein product [Fusarium graminearum]CAG1966862.1 unnamed protein product [Fusarium graminearum]